MRTLRVFLAHELSTQLRSARFYGVSLAYLAVGTAPAVTAYWLSRRGYAFVSPGYYGAMLDLIQPLATTLLAAALAIDIIARERDENSLGVVAMAPISATAYVLNRWLALVGLLLPVTLIPRLAAIALSIQAAREMQDVSPILLGWLVHVVPLLFVVTALAMALGTITSRTVLALLLGLGIFTFGLGITNDLLALTGRQIDGPGEFFGLAEVGPIVWVVKGYIDFPGPSDTGYALAEELDFLLMQSALAAGVAALFLGLSCSYLRRTKRDLRPWRIEEGNQLRSFLRTMNRFREELAPDGGLEVPERIAFAIGVIAPIAVIVMITRRYDAFEKLAEERHAAESRGVEPMPVAIVPASATLKGAITDDGVLDATATLAMRNDGDAPQRELAFALNRGVTIERVSASRGSARVSRLFERVGIVLDPPLAPRETRDVTFALRGAPGTIDFEMPYGATFDQQWRRQKAGKTSIELADLSRSVIHRDVTAQRMYLSGTRLMPVPRYSQWFVFDERWNWSRGQEPMDQFIRDAIRPPTRIAIDLDVPHGFTAVDICGTVAAQHLASRCTSSLADYLLVGARYETLPLTGGVRLLYLPPHAKLARAQAAAFAGGIELARQASPTFAMPEHAVFVERPKWPFERFGGWTSSGSLRSLTTRGAMNIIPEPMLTHLRPLNRNSIAASLIASQMMTRRGVAPMERGFFSGFYETVASWRTGGEKPNPVQPGRGPKPEIDPILSSGDGGWQGPRRLRSVLADVEHRIGSDRLLAGVEDFLAAGPAAGNAKELVATIGRRGGIDLDRYYTDYFVGRELPKLTLKDVTFDRVENGWNVRGRLVNEAGGAPLCPLVLRTAVGAVRTTLQLDAKTSVPFALHTTHEPRVVQLDPEHVVYRHAAIGTVESVDYKEGS